jgi:hypothetical protein
VACLESDPSKHHCQTTLISLVLLVLSCYCSHCKFLEIWVHQLLKRNMHIMY